jgi:hypothetical protein
MGENSFVWRQSSLVCHSHFHSRLREVFIKFYMFVQELWISACVTRTDLPPAFAASFPLTANYGVPIFQPERKKTLGIRAILCTIGASSRCERGQKHCSEIHKKMYFYRVG